MNCCRTRTFTLALVLVLLMAQLAGGDAPAASPGEEAAALHADYSRLLQTYVVESLVDYDTWHGNARDMAALDEYIEKLTALDPAGWPDNQALAYWINLYNAVTLRLILYNYPLESIKDLGGFLKTSPWKRHLVTVGEDELTLNNIENDIIRKEFQEPRIHFALNCASLGCPPLWPEAFVADRLDAQLDQVCRQALNREMWVRAKDGKLEVTKIFDWYGEDFRQDGESVLSFIRRHRTDPIPPGDPEIHFMSYDWSLNEAP